MKKPKDLMKKPKQPKRKRSAKAKAKAKAKAHTTNADPDPISPKSRKTPKSTRLPSKTSDPGSPQSTTLTAVSAPASDPDHQSPGKSPGPGAQRDDMEMAPRQNFDDIAEPETPIGPPSAAVKKRIAAEMQATTVGANSTPKMETVAEGAGEKTEPKPPPSKALQFYEASSLGKIEKIKSLVADGIDVDMVVTDPRNQGCTALLWASFYGELAIVKELMGAKADISKTSMKHGHTAVFCAAQTGRLNVLEYLLEHGADADTANRHGATPLFMSVQGSNIGVLKVLLKHGANVNATTADGQSALTKAAQKTLVDIVKVLLEYGADVYNTAGKYRPLRVAKKQVVKDLLNGKIEVTKGGSVGSSTSNRSDTIPREHTQMRSWNGSNSQEQADQRKSCIVM